MSEKSGFYPSNLSLGIINEYRGYELGRLYKRIINNGVFATPAGTPSTDLQVVASSGLTVKLKAGEGIFLDQWYVNDEDILFTLDGESTLDRIDLIVIEANKNANVLATKAKVLKGTPSAVPVAPTVVDSETVKQYPVAAIRIKAGVTTITQSSITDMRGLAPTLWITSLIKQVDTSELWNQYNTAFWEWFDGVKDTLASTSLIRKYTGYAYTTIENQDDLVVPISQYNPTLDILQVHVEGRILRENVDYTKNGNIIDLNTPLPVINTLVYFEIFKSVDGSDAETYVERLYALEQRVDRSIVTADNGGAKLVITNNLQQEIVNAGVGFHTLEITNATAGMPIDDRTWWGFANFTGPTSGYVIVVSDNGDVYSNVYDGDWWTWRKLYSVNVKLLYSSAAGNFVGASSTINSAKALDVCANGWTLHFAKYGALGDMNFHYNIPKVRYDGNLWNGQTVCIEMPYEFNADGTSKTCYKKLYVYNDKITGFAGNVEAGGNQMVLVGITEY